MSLFKTSDEEKVRLYEIATQMKANGLDSRFIANAVELAKTYEGAFDLFCLWADEKDDEEKDNLISIIQEEIDEFQVQPKIPVKKPYIKQKDLESIAKNVKKFKAHLKNEVDKWGGISKLSKVTGIPQPSLSRFFSSNSMPRRTTLYKIADAINLSESEIITDWAA
jgi:DNA-binding phage protein